MIHNNVIIKSGRYRVRKMTKTQVRNTIRDEGSFHGFICGNRVNPYHLAEGWGLGMRIDAHNQQEFEEEVDKLEAGLRVYTPELGEYAHYYQIIGTDDDSN